MQSSQQTVFSLSHPAGSTYKNWPVFNETAELIDLEQLKEWILLEDEDLLVINKPGWVVCHPSKNGPLSSLVGACRLHCGGMDLHLISRLDRETSGLVILAKKRSMARILQKAIEARQVQKRYLAILEGEMPLEPIFVDQPLARDMDSPVYVKQTVRRSNSAQSARTWFRPQRVGGGYTVVEVELITGRKHQIRAHAQWLGYTVVGDKIYGPDATLFLEFAEKGWTERLGAALPMRRQALHAAKMHFVTPEFDRVFEAPLAWDMAEFCADKLNPTDAA